MGDPFRTVVYREHLATAGAVAFIAAISLTVGYLQFGTVNTGGKVVKAEVLRLETHSVAKVAGGNLPIITVRSPDGSVRQAQATWADVEN